MNTLKCEEVYLSDYRAVADVIEQIPRFIDDVNNTRRLHSALSYLAPATFEENTPSPWSDLQTDGCSARGVHFRPRISFPPAATS